MGARLKKIQMKTVWQDCEGCRKQFSFEISYKAYNSLNYKKRSYCKPECYQKYRQNIYLHS